MALEVMSTRVAINTATGTQDIRISGMSETPKAAIFIWSKVTSGDDFQSSHATSVGFYGNDGAGGDRSYSFGIAGQTAATSNTSRTMSEEAAGVMVVETANPHTLDGRFSGTQFLSDVGSGAGVQITVDDDVSASFMCIVVLFGGSDISDVWVDEHDDLGTGTSPVDIVCGDGGVTTTNFQADLVFAVTVGSNTAITGTDVAGTHGLFSFGAYSRLDSSTQSFIGWANRDARGNSDVSCISNPDRLLGQTIWSSVTWNGLAAPDAAGFTVDPSANAGSDIFAFMAIRFGTVPDMCEISSSTLPSSAADWTEASFSLTPDFGMFGFTEATTQDSIVTADSTWMVGVLETGQVLSAGHAAADGNTNCPVSGWNKAEFFIGDDDATTTLSSGPLDSITTTGWVMDISAAHDSVARVGWSLAIKAAVPAAGTFPYHVVKQTRREMKTLITM